MKFKRSNDAVLTVYTPDSFIGQGCISCSADHNVRSKFLVVSNRFSPFLVVINAQKQGNKRGIDDIMTEKPSEDDLYHFKEAYGELENYSPEHPLNTEAYKKKLQNAEEVTSFCFYTDEVRQFMFSGYGDGLICVWDYNRIVP